MALPPDRHIEQLLLVAASGLAREALAVTRAHPLYEVVGFLDDSPALSGATVDGIPVLGPLDTVARYPNTKVLVCAGHGAVRERIVSRLTMLGVHPDRYATLKHPSVEIPHGCDLGSGSIVLAGVVLTTAVHIGCHVVIMPNVTLTHDCSIQDYGTVCAGAVLGGNVIVERTAYLGMNASVRERVNIGAGATLGMGSVLLNDLPAGQKWAGVPARALNLNPTRNIVATDKSAP